MKYLGRDIDAIISVSEHGVPSLVKLITNKNWLKESINQFDDLAEHEYKNFIEGLYFAYANSVGEGEDCSVDWVISHAIFLIDSEFEFNNRFL